MQNPSTKSTDKVCTIVDEHVPTLRWVVVLNNGETIYQDDGRPGIEPHSAWIRLGNYTRKRNLYIVDMRFEFRSHIINLPSNAEGYYFCLGAMAQTGGGETYHHFIAGFLEEGIIRTVWFQVPELEPTRAVVKNPDEAGPCLIKRQNG